MKDDVSANFMLPAWYDVSVKEGSSLLHWAVYLELPWMVKYLLSRGLDANTESEVVCTFLSEYS